MDPWSNEAFESIAYFYDPVSTQYEARERLAPWRMRDGVPYLVLMAYVNYNRMRKEYLQGVRVSSEHEFLNKLEFYKKARTHFENNATPELLALGCAKVDACVALVKMAYDDKDAVNKRIHQWIDSTTEASPF